MSAKGSDSGFAWVRRTAAASAFGLVLAVTSAFAAGGGGGGGGGDGGSDKPSGATGAPRGANKSPAHAVDHLGQIIKEQLPAKHAERFATEDESFSGDVAEA